MWNKSSNECTWTPRSSQGWEAIVDDRSVIDDEPITIARSNVQTPQQQANSWLQGVATAGEDVQELVMRDLVGREGFQST